MSPTLVFTLCASILSRAPGFYPVRLASIPRTWLLSRAPGFYPARLASIPRALLLSRAPCFYPVRLASIPRTLLLSRTYLTRSIQSDPHSCFHLTTGQSYQYSVAAPRE
jgi:hypothetical protein